MKTQTKRPAPQTRLAVPLSDLGLAPENLRANEPEDAEVPRLAETIRAAGVIYPPIVRKGRKGEAPYMVLDGRRRRFALLRLAEAGLIGADHPVECLLAEDRAAQAAAAVLPNAEHAPVHLADVILAIGKLRRSRLSTSAIAEALGYDELEVKRLEAMAHVHDDVLQAFRLGKITLRQVRLFARIKDVARQGELVQDALAGYFHEYALQSAVTGGRVTVDDPRFALVTETDYAAAGGRLSADLFGELPAEALDPEVLDDCWRAAAARLAQPLVDEGVALSFSRERGFGAPEGLTHLPFIHWGSLSEERRAAFEAVRDRIEAAAAAVEAAGPEDGGAAMAELMLARLALARLSAGGGEIMAALMTPVRGGVDLTFFQRPAPVETEDAVERDDEDDEAGDTVLDEFDAEYEPNATERPGRGRGRRGDIEPVPVEVEVSGVSHAQHAARTEVATRGLIADLAEAPEAAAIVLVAHLFAELALETVRGADDAVLRIRAAGVDGRPADDGLDGGVWARLAAWREAYLASGLRPIAFVVALEPGDRARLLAELTAVTVDLRECRVDQVRRAARAEAQEIAALCQADLAARWTPDAGFLDLHSRAQLTGFLADMGARVDKAAALKKPELVRAVAEAAAARRWVPGCLRWPQAVGEPAEAGAPEPEPETADPEAVDAGELAAEAA